MKAITIDAVRWFLEDERLIDAVAGITPLKGQRRTFFTRPFLDSTVFIKYFNEQGISGSARNKILPRGKREYEQGRRLRSLAVPTPNPMGYGLSPKGSFLIQEHVLGESLATALSAPEGRGEFLPRLAGFLKTLKQAGVRHNDLHLDNVLVTEAGLLVVIDLHTMRFKRTFTVKDDISNLSHALAMIYRGLSDDELRSFFDAYGTPSLRRDVEKEIERMEVRWVRSKEKRAFQDTSRLVTQGRFVFMAGMESMADGEFLGILKEDRKVKVERYSNHIRKTYRNARRLKRAWRAHTVLAYMGMKVVPEPFFVRKPGLTSPGAIAMEDLTGRGEELDRFLDGRYRALSLTEQRRFIRTLSAFFVALARRGIVHKDLKGCNVFALDDGGFRLLDVEDVVFHTFEEKDLKRMAMQLNTTVPGYITARDRLRFFLPLKGFVEGNWKRLFAEIVRESMNQQIVYEGMKGLTIESWGEERP
jgi:tRNA A-37 threonylcarbamoyl transferase component Bud32